MAPFERETHLALILWGVLVWAAVYALVRVGGHVLLDPANPTFGVAFFVSVLPLMALVTYPIYRWFEIPHRQRIRAAAFMSLPGTVLDALLVVFARATLPNLGPETVINFGAILLYGYAVVLVTGFVPRS